MASATPIDERVDKRGAVPTTSQPQASSLYASLDHTAERQGVPQDVILQILKIHAYETDFRQRVRAGDGFEFFFDVKEDDKGIDGGLGELLATVRHLQRRDAQVLSLPHPRRHRSTTTTSRATPRASS